MIIADADNGLSAVLNNDSPPTKMFVFGTKARDDEAKRTMVLDFDGKLGRVSDPVFEPGQVDGVDDILFNSTMTEEELMDGDAIYNSDEDEKIIFPDEISVNTTPTSENALKEVLDLDKGLPEKVSNNDKDDCFEELFDL